MLHCPQSLNSSSGHANLVRLSLRRPGRGASPSAKPYFFVRKHHAYRPGRASGDPDVVLHHPQSLIPSSGSTTPPGPIEPPAAGAWCFTVRKSLFLRSEAPRLSARSAGAFVGVALPAKPYSFVRKHHAYRLGPVRRRLCWRRPPRKALTLRRVTPTWPGRASGNPGFPFPIRRECDEHI